MKASTEDLRVIGPLPLLLLLIARRISVLWVGEGIAVVLRVAKMLSGLSGC